MYLVPVPPPFVKLLLQQLLISLVSELRLSLSQSLQLRSRRSANDFGRRLQAVAQLPCCPSHGMKTHRICLYHRSSRCIQVHPLHGYRDLHTALDAVGSNVFQTFRRIAFKVLEFLQNFFLSVAGQVTTDTILFLSFCALQRILE